MHIPKHIAMLQAAAHSDRLDQVIEQIRQENPEAFHSDETLSSRVFVHQPGIDIPCVRESVQLRNELSYFRGLGIVR